MRLLVKLFVAFCVATILAQGIILGISAFHGNLKHDTMVKAIALLNGIDITGDQIRKMLDESRQVPVPTYDDVKNTRAMQDKNLQMRQESIERMKTQVDEMLAELKAETSDFDRRKDEFYVLLDKYEKEALDEGLQKVQQTIEQLSPEQAKDQLLRILKEEEIDDVVAIVKEMASDKRKKILGEFQNEEEAKQLHEILMRLRAGEPRVGVIRDAREKPTSS